MKTQCFDKMKYDLKGHIRSLLCQKHSSPFVYEPILMKTCMSADIMKTQYMTRNVTFMLWRSFVIFFTLRPFDRITALRSYGKLLSLWCGPNNTSRNWMLF